RDGQRLALRGADRPDEAALVVDALGPGVGGVHPVERLVGAAVRVHGDAPVGLDHHQPGGEGQVGGEAAVVVDGAAGDDEAHGGDDSGGPRPGRRPPAGAAGPPWPTAGRSAAAPGEVAADGLAPPAQLPVGEPLGARVDAEARLHAVEVDLDRAGVDADVLHDPVAVAGGEVHRQVRDLAEQVEV